MPLRLLSANDEVKVYHDSNNREYVVKPIATIKDDSTWYFTDDKEDAFDTAVLISMCSSFVTMGAPK